MSELNPTPTTAKAFADMARTPGETDVTAMLRRVKMHEYLMTGGVKIGVDEHNHPVYGPAITIHDLAKGEFSDCPFHPGDDCEAWKVIRAGDGYWTGMEFELDALQEKVNAEGGYEADAVRITELADKLTSKPVQHAYVLPAQRAPRQPMDHAKSRKADRQAGKSRKPFPWSKAEEPSPQKKALDGMTAAISGLASTKSDDVIEFDGEEEESE